METREIFFRDYGNNGRKHRKKFYFKDGDWKILHWNLFSQVNFNSVFPFPNSHKEGQARTRLSGLQKLTPRTLFLRFLETPCGSLASFVELREIRKYSLKINVLYKNLFDAPYRFWNNFKKHEFGSSLFSTICWKILTLRFILLDLRISDQMFITLLIWSSSHSLLKSLLDQ